MVIFNHQNTCRFRQFRRLSAAALILLLSAGLAGCSGSNGNSTQTAETSSAETTQPEEPTAAAKGAETTASESASNETLSETSSGDSAGTDQTEPTAPSSQTAAPAAEIRRVLEPQYDEAGPYSEGFAVVGREQDGAMKYNYIDLEGHYLLDEWVDMAFPFRDGRACAGFETPADENITVYETYYRFGYVDDAGTWAIPAQYLGTRYTHPLYFYDGYAEIDYYLPEDSTYAPYYELHYNVIDKQGNRLYDFDAVPSGDFGYDGGMDDYRLLPLEWTVPAIGNYYSYSAWMQNHYNGEPQTIQVVHDDDSSYQIGPDNAIVARIPGQAYEMNDSYYSVSVYDEETYDTSYSVYDRDFHFVQNGQFYANLDGTYFTEYVTSQDENGWTVYSYRLCGQDLRPLTGFSQSIIQLGTGGYLFQTSDTSWDILDANLQTAGQIEGAFDWVSELSDPWHGYKRQWIVGHTSTSEGTVLALFDNSGTPVCRTPAGNYEFWFLSDELLILNDGNSRAVLIDAAGNEVMELPYPYAYPQEPSEDGSILHLYTYASNDPQRFYELYRENGQWTLAEEDNPNNSSEPVVLGENDASRILGLSLWYDISEERNASVTLTDAADHVLEESVAAVSLVTDGLYLTASRIDYDEETYSYIASGMCLKAADHTLPETVYDRLGPLSENRIPFLENGKWGYLELERK